MKTITAEAKITDILMEETPEGWVAHCTVKSKEPTLTLGTFDTEPVKLPEDLPAALEKGLKKFAKRLKGSLIPIQH